MLVTTAASRVSDFSRCLSSSLAAIGSATDCGRGLLDSNPSPEWAFCIDGQDKLKSNAAPADKSKVIAFSPAVVNNVNSATPQTHLPLQDSAASNLNTSVQDVTAMPQNWSDAISYSKALLKDHKSTDLNVLIAHYAVITANSTKACYSYLAGKNLDEPLTPADLGNLQHMIHMSQGLQSGLVALPQPIGQGGMMFPGFGFGAPVGLEAGDVDDADDYDDDLDEASLIAAQNVAAGVDPSVFKTTQEQAAALSVENEKLKDTKTELEDTIKTQKTKIEELEQKLAELEKNNALGSDSASASASQSLSASASLSQSVSASMSASASASASASMSASASVTD